MPVLIIESTRTLGETIHTYALPRHEDLTPITLTDVERVTVSVYMDGSDDAEFDDEPDADDLFFDTPQEWPIDRIGYTFLYSLPYDDEFMPPPGKCHIEIALWRTDDRGPLVIHHDAHLIPSRVIGDFL